jgi:phage terminase small subunit
MANLTAKQEKFANEVVLNGGDKVAAYKSSGYSTNMKSDAISVKADEVYNNGKVSVRIAELQKIADEKAKEVFSISVEQRLKWLNEVANAGLSKYIDPAGNERRENLTAVTGAVKTMNEMLGVSDSTGGTKPVKVIVGVVDAS